MCEYKQVDVYFLPYCCLRRHSTSACERADRERKVNMETSHLQGRSMPHEVISVERKWTRKEKDGKKKSKTSRGKIMKKGKKDYPDYLHITAQDEENETETQLCERCIQFRQNQFCMTCDISETTGKRLPRYMHPCVNYDGEMCSDCEWNLITNLF